MTSAKRAIFAFQDVVGAWLLIGADRTDRQRPYVFAIDPKLAHSHYMRSLLLNELSRLWDLPLDLWTELELLHPFPALAINTGVHTLFNVISATHPTHINGWCTREFGESVIQRWLSYFLASIRHPPPLLSEASRTRPNFHLHFVTWIHTWHSYAGESLSLTRAEVYLTPPYDKPGAQFTSRYWAQYSDSTHPHIVSSAALSRARTLRRATLLRTLPDQTYRLWTHSLTSNSPTTRPKRSHL